MERHVFHKILSDLMLRPFIHDLFHSTKPKQSVFFCWEGGEEKLVPFPSMAQVFGWIWMWVSYAMAFFLVWSPSLLAVTCGAEVSRFFFGSFVQEVSWKNHLYIYVYHLNLYPFISLQVGHLEYFLSAFLGQVTKTKMIIYPKQLEELILTYSWWWRNPKTTTWDV